MGLNFVAVVLHVVLQYVKQLEGDIAGEREGGFYLRGRGINKTDRNNLRRLHRSALRWPCGTLPRKINGLLLRIYDGIACILSSA